MVWDKTGFGTRVAAVRVGEGPLWLVAGHRAPGVLPVFVVPDLATAVTRLQAAGWTPHGEEFEVPDGPCRTFKDPSGNELTLMEETRPNAFGV